MDRGDIDRIKHMKRCCEDIAASIRRFGGSFPTIRLAEMSVEDIAGRDLLPIGQFYMRTFEPLTKNNVGAFNAAASLLAELKGAV